MELKQLEYFQMASRLKNITRAAERLKVSQPNITIAIKKLETELGVVLFDRKQKQLNLTPEGKIFLARVNFALQQITDAVLEVNDCKDLRKGTIKIGIPPMMGARMFPRIFSKFKERYPHLDVYLYEEGSMAIRDLIEKDELDFGIVITSNPSINLETLPISKANIVCCTQKDGVLSAAPYVSVGDMINRNLIMLRDGSYVRRMILKWLSECGIEPHIILETNQIGTIKALIKQGAGMSFLLDIVVDDEPEIQQIPLEDNLSVDIGLAWKKEHYISKASQCFMDFCKEIL